MLQPIMNEDTEPKKQDSRKPITTISELDDMAMENYRNGKAIEFRTMKELADYVEKKTGVRV
ncbi:hypothetical protein FACS189499_06520 [Clostridia bacterium]|nr:hypothetical protein FACS189499_06520 [Clostridia bacterium]